MHVDFGKGPDQQVFPESSFTYQGISKIHSRMLLYGCQDFLALAEFSYHHHKLCTLTIITGDGTTSDEEGSDTEEDGSNTEEESADGIVIGIGKMLELASDHCNYLFCQQNCGGGVTKSC